MPYILIHPLPPPRNNPHHPSLPGFTTASRTIALFFHSRGWRARHVYVPPRCSEVTEEEEEEEEEEDEDGQGSVSSTSYIAAHALSTPLAHPTAEHESDYENKHNTEHDNADECEQAEISYHPTTRPTTLLSCGPVVELHDYGIPINAALFHGPRASDLQVRWLRYYAWGCIDFGEGEVDLRVLNTGEKRRVSKRVQSEMIEMDEDAGEGLEEDIDEELAREWEVAERALLATGELEWVEGGKRLRKMSDE